MADPNTGGGWSWGRLVARSALGSAIALAAVTALVFKEVVPPIAAMTLLLGAGGLLASRPGNRGVTGVSLAAAGAALYVGLAGGFVLGVVGAPEEPREFIPLVSGFVLALVALGSTAVVAVRGRGRGFARSTAARAVAWMTTTAVVVLSGWSLYAGATFESAAAAAGDLRIAASEFTFTPAGITANAGRIGVHIDNAGRGLHTFTISELGADVDIPAGQVTASRVRSRPGRVPVRVQAASRHGGTPGRQLGGWRAKLV